ncbi:efflux RND transporter permease subunit [Sphingomonas solaris]|uniref:Efflux pump membrane transporter n=1 Tax=Alterirhizorhabdus solaris TaxID=2529389 RepID=A0A558R8H9_9SPHN|nr:efflux RND transporter permease subunit [Sphingomonas solaris]TVV75628.1 efflux RND transporter permease subunit [Sphingomonas solaris]
MISRIFIDRPIFAWVIAIIIMLGGIGGILSMPVGQYPDIAPPSINIRANYPGASAEILESSVTQVIEQQLTGLDGLIYFSATSSSAGSVTITVTFEKGVDPDIAQVQVQNKVQQALPRLPTQVQQQGLVVTKSNPDLLMIISLYDETDRSTVFDVSDYMVSTLQDPIGRIEGVGDVNVFGAQYAMRIWLDPFRLSGYGLIPADVTAAIQAQNTQVAAGQIGAQPSPPGQMLNAIVTARSRLTTVDQFRKIIVKTQSSGAKVLLQDVARVELGSESYVSLSRLNGHPGAGIGIQLAPGADALKTAELVKADVEARSKSFPAGYRYAIPNDSTAFIKLSVEEVVKTLLEAIVLVVIVMFVFLQSWRATLIPAIAVPVVLLGTFGILAIFGFSINTLTLFGLVLSIGLLVDDAIVVVENVERVMHEEPDISARDATIKSMGEIQTALIAIALVLSAVFMPMAFFGGSIGVIYRQFSITIVSSMILSVLVALVLSPALAATLLKRRDPAAADGNRFARIAHRFGDRFNNWFDRTADRYRTGVERVLRHGWLWMLGYAAIAAAFVAVFLMLPTSFLPNEDQGRAQLQFTLPPGATQERTLNAAKQVEAYFRKFEAANASVIFTIIGGGPGGSGQNAGRGYISFAPWDDRHGAENAVEAVNERANKALASLRDVEFFATSPPAVRGLGQSNGFTMELLDTGGLDRLTFNARRDQLLAAARADPALSAVRLNGLEDVPTLQVDIDQEKVGALGISQAQVDSTLSAAWGGSYVNDFVDRGRVKRVYVQGDAPYRSRPEDLANWFVRTETGTMAPFSAFSKVSWGQAPTTLNRFNGQSAFEIQGQPAPGHSSGEAMDRMTELAGQLPGTSVAWSGLSYQERLSGGQTPILYGLSLLVVFLCLAALYESWSIPFSVMLVIPLGLVGAAVAVALRGLENDVYFQVGLLTTMGLSAKNAILIVEFAEQAEKRGATPAAAALEAARLRLRPILMTSLAFIFGVLPLAISTGAGAASRVAIGTAVIGGMLTATVLAIFFVPLFFVLVRRWFGPRVKDGDAKIDDSPAPAPTDRPAAEPA